MALIIRNTQSIPCIPSFLRLVLRQGCPPPNILWIFRGALNRESNLKKNAVARRVGLWTNPSGDSFHSFFSTVIYGEQERKKPETGWKEEVWKINLSNAFCGFRHRSDGDFAPQNQPQFRKKGCFRYAKAMVIKMKNLFVLPKSGWMLHPATASVL